MVCSSALKIETMIKGVVVTVLVVVKEHGGTNHVLTPTSMVSIVMDWMVGKEWIGTIFSINILL